MRNPFRYFNSSPEVIRLTVMMDVAVAWRVLPNEDRNVPCAGARGRLVAQSGSPGILGVVQKCQRRELARRHEADLRAVAIGDDRLETSTILSRDDGPDVLSHGAAGV